MERIYGADAGRAERRLRDLEAGYRKAFGAAGELEFFTSPGRTEIIGNHTDHNGGRILAGSVTKDTVCAAERNGTSLVRIVSEGYGTGFTVDSARPEETPREKGTLSLIAGVLAGMREAGYRTGGFNAYVSTEVLSAAGISSSASFEMLLCSVLNYFFNGDAVDVAARARAGQYAENRYWNKASGLMDQMACACGGTILLDFSGDVRYERVDFRFGDFGYDEILVNSGKGHADLSEEYSAIPNEMRLTARELGGKNLCECSEEELLKNFNAVRKRVGNDRALLRALHFFEENRRVDTAVRAMKACDSATVVRMIDEGGRSSFEWLQNAYVTGTPEEQSVPLALALTRLFLREKGAGACRIHGGGFGGVIMTVLPRVLTPEYTERMASYFGAENVYVTGIRDVGAAHIG